MLLLPEIATYIKAVDICNGYKIRYDAVIVRNGYATFSIRHDKNSTFEYCKITLYNTQYYYGY